PIDEDGFPINVLAVDEAPGAAIVGGTAVVAQDIVLIQGHALGTPGDAIAVFLGHVLFHHQVAVHIDLARNDIHDVARNPDDALDVRLRSVQGIPEHHHITTLD